MNQDRFREGDIAVREVNGHHLTEGKEYEVLAKSGAEILIKDDLDKIKWFLSGNFAKKSSSE